MPMLRLKSAFLGNNGPTEPLSTVAEGEAADQFPPLASPSPAPQQENPATPVPHWVRELNNSRLTRHSRASSIVSTRTKFSTTTLQEDARSIDINVAGQYFRISRDGSRVTADAPPPYTAPGETIRFRGGQASGTSSFDALYGTSSNDGDNDSETEDEATTPRSTVAIGVRANIIDPTEFDMPSPVTPDQLNHRPSSATLTDNASSSDNRSHSEDGNDEVARQERSVFRGNLPALPTASRSMPTTPRRRIRLPPLVTSGGHPGILTHTQRSSFSRPEAPGRTIQSLSAGPVLSHPPGEREPRSPDYIGRNASALFPSPSRPTTTEASNIVRDSSSGLTGLNLGERGLVFDNPLESQTPLPMDTENDISLHYARMMRKLDYNYRKAMHLKDKELAEMRVRLHEKDTVLRQQLRAKDFMIDDLKKRLSNLEENVEAMLEKARNQVEDLWEKRWQDRDFHIRERMRRIEEEAQRTIERLRQAQQETHGGSSASPTRI